MPKPQKKHVKAEPTFDLYKSLFVFVLAAWFLLAFQLSGGLPRLSFEATSVVAIPVEILRGGINPSIFLGVLKEILLALFFFGVAILLGNFFLRYVRPPGATAGEKLIFSLGLGLGIFSQAGLLAGLAGFFTPVFLARAFIISAIVGVSMNARRIINYSTYFRAAMNIAIRQLGLFDALIISLLVCLIVLNFIGAVGPTIFYDTLQYHFALPKLYLMKGRIFPTPYNIYSGIPFNTELLYGIAFALGGEGLAKLIPLGISIALIVSMLIYANRLGNLRMGLLAALIFYSSPMICSQVWYDFVELNWAFLGFLALFSLVVALHTGDCIRWIMLTGIFAGLTMGVKYNAFSVLIVLVAVLIMHQLTSQNEAKTPHLYLIVTILAVVLVSPWLIKNCLFYRNPIFPFYNEFFTNVAEGPDWRGLVQDAKSRSFASLLSLNGLKDLFWDLWSRNTGPEDDVGVAFFSLSPLIFFFRRNQNFKPLSAALFASWLAWSLSSRMPRFFVCALPVLALLIAASLVSEEIPKRWRSMLFLWTLFICVSNSVEVLANWYDVKGWRVVFGQQSKDDYLRHTQNVYPCPYYAAVEFINRKLPANSKVLFLHESRGYYCERDFIATSIFGRNPILDMADQSKNLEELRKKLKSEGITHILINYAETIRIGHISSLAAIKKSPLVLSLRASLPKIFEYRLDDPKDIVWVALYEVR